MPKIQDCRLGKWKKTEHDRFMKALSKYGKNWTLIQKAVKTRTLAQVRSHSQKLFLSMTPKEINLFEEEINRRFESFCSMKKKSELSK
jgi:SHAQKYF class myb-like DNA-binding protein